MTKVIGMLVALAMFCAVPALAFGQDFGGDEPNEDSVETVTGGDSGASAGGGGAGGGGYDGGAGGGDGGDNNVACSISQTAGGDANAVNNCGNRGVEGVVDDDDNVGGGNVTGFRGGRAQGVTLARTGLDAWMLALLGGLSLTGGLGLLVAQRRGRIGA